jgi:hypothetical protein
MLSFNIDEQSRRSYIPSYELSRVLRVHEYLVAVGKENIARL